MPQELVFPKPDADCLLEKSCTAADESINTDIWADERDERASLFPQMFAVPKTKASDQLWIWKVSSRTSIRCPSKWKARTFGETSFAQATRWQTSIWRMRVLQSLSIARTGNSWDCAGKESHIRSTAQLSVCRRPRGFSVFQSHKAKGGNDCSQSSEHQNNQLHRPHPGYGAQQRGCRRTYATRLLPGFCWRTWSSRSLFMTRSPWSTLPNRKNSSVSLQTRFWWTSSYWVRRSRTSNRHRRPWHLLLADRRKAREVSRLREKLTHASLAMRTALFFTGTFRLVFTWLYNLLITSSSNRLGSKRRAEFVGQPSYLLEREVAHSRRSAGPHDRSRCLPNRLGRTLLQPLDRKTFVPTRGNDVHQLPEATGSKAGSPDLCQKVPWSIWRCTQASVLTYINKMGETVSPELNQLIKQLGLGACPEMSSSLHHICQALSWTRNQTRNQGSFRL